MKMNEISAATQKIAALFEELARRAGSSPFGSCPVDLTAAMVRMCLAQSCGKCVPCRIGLDRLAEILDRILAGEGKADDLKLLEASAQSIYDSADCAIGFEAAKMVLDGLVAFRDDYRSHLEKGTCTSSFASVPCMTGCPAHVNIPGYIACIAAGRYADAVRVIREDNPFPTVCGLICEHPCETYCRRKVVDDALNIRGLKRYAVERAGEVPPPAALPRNGKRVGIVGGGPAGLTAAYFLSLRGFEVTVHEARAKLGGMLRYGIPAYRLDDANLDRDLRAILATGVEVKFNSKIGRDLSFAEFRKQFDAVYVSIGAQGAKQLRVEGEAAKGVLSAVELLSAVGEGERPDFKGKRVIVVGGGNVAMDATRTARRLGAKSVTCVYRRRIEDMTALPEEVAGAEAEGCEVRQLLAPVRIATENGVAAGLVVKPQLAGPIEKGRPKPIAAAEPEFTIPAELIVVAIGQDIDSEDFVKAGLEAKRGALVAAATGEALAAGERLEGVFTGGDCWSGPATVIRAIDAGKVAAANIAAYLGHPGELPRCVEIPPAPAGARLNWGRVKLQERSASERQGDFSLMEKVMSDEAAQSECRRCLRCDHCGMGAFKGGRAR